MDTTQTTPVEESQPTDSKFIDPADAPQFFIEDEEDEDEEEAESDESEDDEDDED